MGEVAMDGVLWFRIEGFRASGSWERMGGVGSGAGDGQFGSTLVGIGVASLVGQEDVVA